MDKLYSKLFFITSMLLFQFLVKGQDMQATIVRSQELEDIPSASGIEFRKGNFYIMGDDSPWLFELDKDFRIKRKIEVFSPKKAEQGRIPKKYKPDFEALMLMKWGKDKDLLLFGSGSSSGREILTRVDFDSSEVHTEKYQLDKFYKYLREVAGIDPESFNIEGAAVWGQKLLLLNRGSNTLFIIEKNDFKAYIKDNDKKKPEVIFYHYRLPGKDGNTARFSGATLLPGEDMLLFTATVENTPDWINDGKILGSYIGLIDLNNLSNPEPVSLPVMDKDRIYTGKIESLVCTGKNQNQINILAVTDNDNGRSLLLHIEFLR